MPSVLVPILVLLFGQPAADRWSATPDEVAAFLAWVERLSAPELAGRGLGEPGLDTAAVLLEQDLARAGLEPLFGTSFRQSFTLVLTDPGWTRCELYLGGQALACGEEAVPVRFASPGRAQAGAVFVGYGRSQAGGPDDYAGIDVRGQVVVALRHQPRGGAAGRPGLPVPLHAADPEQKARAAREHGAAALLLVNDPTTYAERPQEDLPTDFSERAVTYGLPVFHLPWRVLGPFLSGLGADLADWQADLDRGNSVSRPLGITVTLELARPTRSVTLTNLAARLPGDPTLPLVLLGAHYDHLGRALTRDPPSADSWGPGTWHPGADDNASGVAGLLALAQGLLREGWQGRSLGVGLVFFTGEESDALGSQHFVDHPPLPLDQVVALVNLDQIGRLRDRRFLAIGSGSAAEWPLLLDRAVRGLPLCWVPHASGYAPSDQSAFLEAGVPVLHLYTGVTPEQHTPRDTPGLIDARGALALVELATRLVRELDAYGAPLTPLPAGPRPGFDSAPERQEWLTGRGLTMELAGDGQGVRVRAVAKGSPAQRAGLASGDLLLEWDGRVLRAYADYADALKMTPRNRAIEIRFLRDGQERRATVPRF
jgi:hypothetical protein